MHIFKSKHVEHDTADKEFVMLRQKIIQKSSKLGKDDAYLVRIWLEKLIEANPAKRTAYSKCLMYQVEKERLETPFNEFPTQGDLLPLHEALHGPLPKILCPQQCNNWTAERSNVHLPKQMSQEELKEKYGTDRIGLHTRIMEHNNIDSITVQKLVALAGPYTKDGGTLLVKTMQEELQDFRKHVRTFYDQHSRKMAEDLGKQQIAMIETFKREETNLLRKRQELLDQLKKKSPEFNWSWFKSYNKVDDLKLRRLKKLREEALLLEQKNETIRRRITKIENMSGAHN